MRDSYNPPRYTTVLIIGLIVAFVTLVTVFVQEWSLAVIEIVVLSASVNALLLKG